MRHVWVHVACLAATVCAHAQSPGAVRDPAEQLLREQEQRRREELLRQDNPALQPEVPAAVEEDGAGFPEHLAPAGPVFRIDTILRDGDALLDDVAFERVVAPFTGRELGTPHINRLLDRVSRALIDAGYTTSRAYVGPQNLAQGVLRVTVVAGRIESLRYNGAPLADAAPGVRWALPMREGDVLYLPDIEQAVDQLNRLRANRAQVQIRPGTLAGGSIVELTNPQQAGAGYSLSLDNQGASSTGVGRLHLSADWGDALGLMESIRLGLSTSRDTNALYGTVAVPWGYHTVSLMSSVSEYQNLIGDTALVYGRTQSHSLAWNRLVARGQSHKTALDVSLTRRASWRWINNAALMPQTQAVVRLGLNHLQRVPTRHGVAQWTLDAGVVRGLHAFGADRDAHDLPPEAARAQFTKLELSASSDWPLAGGAIWRARAAGQWSRHPLYSSEQLFAGGMSSVRGAADSAIGGERGAQLRNEWAWPGLWHGSNWRVEPYVFLDGARVHAVADRQWSSLLSSGAGLRVALGAGQAEFIAGKPLHTPSATPSGWRLHVQFHYAL